MQDTHSFGISDEDFATYEGLVGRLCALPLGDARRRQAEKVAASFVWQGRNGRRLQLRAERTLVDARLAAGTVTGATDRREDAPLTLPQKPGPIGEYAKPRCCYVCKEPYRQVDGFYHLLCPVCAADNAARRGLNTDLRGRRALLTGGRVKIGFQLALMLLRDGAELITTSRFPHDTLRRFRAAPGSDAWWDRLTVVGIDLRDPRQVLAFCEELRQEGRPLDILVNNAAQTLRRPPESYAQLAAGELTPLPGALGALVRHAPGFRPMPALSPAWPTAELEAAEGPLPQVRARTAGLQPADEAGLLPDLAAENSWSVRLGGLDPAELLETQLVNSVAPALLCDRLLPLLLASPRPARYVVNVTAVEGRFAVRNKTARHPHTNMAKAALNMLTRTSAEQLARQGVHMCAVDTGWITDENPAPKKAYEAARGFRTPLDVVDGAARVYDPIVRGEAGHPVSGVFLKDYRVADW
ncbi:SDR family NAD(P)-dependent oxidoreductase [Streptacidiphilus neutrinimicus]|uniref:SDR family NAD(P)-dependent oxidoreductase n=1 Tax=Streptacidiphilus neutrinimicus TaxID=105420 RepID=UPI0005AB4799|nr:SDR family NAD(P)-dependent oxidoreductase [Streptacidiphilus neutrinimicus]